MFRPCIDLHNGKVKQIVGGTLRDGGRPVTNFETDRPAACYAARYRDDGLHGGHVILLGPGNEAPARAALAAYPGGLQVGGGIHPGSAAGWLAAGASHVIVTSYVFREGRVDHDRLREMADAVGAARLVLDLSCRRRDGRYLVVTDRWQTFTETEVHAETLAFLAGFAAEFLVHAADVEGRQAGIDEELVRLLGEACPIPVTYAGGARALADLERVHRLGGGRVDLTIGSALDLFGGPIPYREVVALDRRLRAG
ncbi:MAG: phosphoribosylformimino-5-aminoimidazole carboxamide ribotide isomerase [Armatimonadetes bacterium]|nr:phosphoribosylformimino-5-aminoimidazole carboxamide ribotide isomerase [Armatimonadota bacterium]